MSDASTPENTHPLNRTWTFHYFKPFAIQDKTADYSQQYDTVCDFSTAEDLVAVLKNIPNVETLQVKSRLSIFESGIKPEWEDPHHLNGGRIRYEFTENAHSTWENFLYFILGEQLGEVGRIVTGIEVVPQKGKRIRIDIWLRALEPTEVIDTIGNTLKSSLSLDQKLNFSPFEPEKHPHISAKDF
ncbi:hypothetical protein RCL1_002707 [Eukaryota sp. TZLM3-RCL]